MNKELIFRLSKYKRLLLKFKALGLEKVFSNNLGDAIHVTPALVRKDFSLMNIVGNKRGGYTIDDLLVRLDEELGKEPNKEVVLIGCGRIGSALMQYKGFTRDGIKIVAGFDADPRLINRDADIPIYDIAELQDFTSKRSIKVGIISVPDNAAAHVLELMIDAGIYGILNFAPVELKCNRKYDKNNQVLRCNIQNVNIGMEIENLFYMVNIAEAGRLPAEET
ncbi:MAG: redox-sensing transcriptional repressor Rex [Spirochaetales bacterium]|nr:MAG: redox-sensing transcriptional repressor Rex [Spirochaetales bacterium]